MVAPSTWPVKIGSWAAHMLDLHVCFAKVMARKGITKVALEKKLTLPKVHGYLRANFQPNTLYLLAEHSDAFDHCPSASIWRTNYWLHRRASRSPTRPLFNQVSMHGCAGFAFIAYTAFWVPPLARATPLSERPLVLFPHLLEGGTPTTASLPAPEAEPPPQGGGEAAQGGSQPAAPQGGAEGRGDPSQPSANRRPTRPVQAGLPGLSTLSKPKRGRGVAGANTASRAPAQGCHRPAAAHGLFALGFTRAATVMSPGDEGQGRAHSENT